MEYENIKKLIDDMGNSSLSEISIDFPDGTKISMKKENKQEKVVVTAKEIIANEEINEEVRQAENKKEVSGNIVKSPMVGTFYLKPSPTSEPYVEVGKTVKKGDTLCIIEAMKLMNEIESEFAGTISKVLVEDGTPVEYGTELFIIE
ncbi:MAG: acetyl-CoA carboxylase biotin carboxyl carrier protein [Clostridia bacterium]|nr:acetyl-CoA carboxylase biotin carboxyl carrier protein [Clostridia bacterium]